MVRVAFVQNITYEYVGLMHISALLKKGGHEVDVFIEHGQGDAALIAEITSFAPDVIGFPCTTGVHTWSLKIARTLKERCSALMLFGGPHPTFFPEIIEEPAVDIVCRGEGEYPVRELADRLSRGEDYSLVENFWVKTAGGIVRNDVRRLVENLDELPFLDRDLYVSKYHFLRRTQKAFIGSRGCPFDCSYCFNHALKKIYEGKGTFVRFRSVDNLIAEIKDVRSRFLLETLFFQDDTFTLNRNWVLEFTEKYRREVGLPFVCLIRADIADEEIVKNLKEAGCTSVFFGIESGSEEFRNKLLQKKITNEEIYRLAGLLRKYGIRFRTYNIVGLPEETIEDAFKTVAINTRIKTDYPWCALFQPYPRTELGEYARREDLIIASVNDICPSFFQSSILKSPYKRQLENLQKLFYYAVKFPRLLPVIKVMIKWKPSFLFVVLFLASHGWCAMRGEDLTLREVVTIGLKNLKNFFLKHN